MKRYFLKNNSCYKEKNCNICPFYGEKKEDILQNTEKERIKILKTIEINARNYCSEKLKFFPTNIFGIMKMANMFFPENYHKLILELNNLNKKEFEKEDLLRKYEEMIV